MGTPVNAVVFAIFVLLIAVAQAGDFADPPNQESLDVFAGSPVYVTPAGTFLRYKEQTVFLQGIHLPQQVISTLMQAGVATILPKLIHHLMVFGMARAEGYVPEYNYQKLKGWFRDGTLLQPLNLWYWSNNIRRAVSLGWASYQEARNRYLNIRRGYHLGRMPFYLGNRLEQSALIDVCFAEQVTPYSADSAHSHIEIIPFSSPAHFQGWNIWEQTLAYLIHRLFKNDVKQLHIVEEAGGELFLEWFQVRNGEGEWRKTFFRKVYPVAEECFKESHLLSTLSPENLRCIAEMVSGKAYNCEAHEHLTSSGEQVVHFSPAQAPMGTGYLRLTNNPSWSPGLPGHLSLVSHQIEPDASGDSRQFRMPYWASLWAEALFHELAVVIVRHSVEAGEVFLNRRLHGAHRFTVDKVLKTERSISGKDIPTVERVKDPSGKLWVRKSSPWSAITSSNRYSFLHLAEEAHILSRFHDGNIVKYHDSWLENAGSDKARLVIIEEYGGTKTNDKPPETFKEFKVMMTGALKAIEAAEKVGIAHFDISDTNMVKDENGTVRLIDFGVARHLDKSGEAYPQRSTPLYLAPKRYNRQRTSHKVDIWALGTVGVHWTRRLKVMGSGTAGYALMLANKKREPFDLGKYMKTDTELFDFLNSMLNPDQNKRPTASELLKHKFLQSKT